MDPRRLSAGEWIGAAGGVVLVVALFLPWYRVGGAHVNAWDSMAVDDVLLAIAGVGAVVAALATARRRGAVPVANTVLASLGGIVAVILVVLRMLDPAPPVDVSLGVGAWLGLAGALAVAGGFWAGMKDEGPERRSAARERAAAKAALERTELLPLPPDVRAQ